jgi:cell division protein FtsI (penicillin-binding protein 3)
MATNQARGAWAIVQRVKTGEILAMATRPDLRPEHLQRGGRAGRLNRAIGYVFEPGSVFKVAVYAAALNEGLVRAGRDDRLRERVVDAYAGKPLRDFHPYGRLTRGGRPEEVQQHRGRQDRACAWARTGLSAT